MALQVWLPLLGSTVQQGLSNATVTNCSATANNSGKIGKCYSFDGTGNQYIIGTQSYFTNATATEWSYACWIKVNNSHNGCIWSCRNSTNNAGMTIFYYGGSWIFDDGNRWQFSPNTTISSGVWYHICFTRSATTGKRCFYLNGVLDSTTSTSTAPTNVCTTHFAIGNSQNSAQGLSGNPFNGYLNDVRLYSHALSPKEIEILARGLVLHYPLSDPYIEDTTNMITIQTASAANIGGWGGHSTQRTIVDATNYPIPCNTCNKLAVTYSGSGGGGSGMSLQRINCSPSTTYTYSCYLKTPDALGPLNANILYRYEYKSDNTKATEAGCWGPTSNVQTLSDGWYRIWGTFTVTANTTYFDVYNFVYPNKTCDYYIGCWQLELKNHVTPYVFGSRSENIVYDVSGCNYHGTKVGLPIYSADTPRYSNSTSFDGVDDCIQVPLNTFFPNAGSFTINLWFKKHELGSKGYETVFGGISGFEIDTRNSTSTTLSYYVTGNSRGLTVQSPLSFDTWYMLTMVCDGTNELYYLNGEYKKQIEKKGMPTGNYFIGAWRDVASQNFKGLISDFRVYATVLTAEDIQKLYNTTTSISNT